MSQTQHMYTPPRTTAGNDVPAGLAGYLDGEDLLAKTQALRLSTVDADGWPRAALLSAGDALLLPDGRLRFAIFADSGTAANLARDGRLTVSLSLDGGMCELRTRARGLRPMTAADPLVLFVAQVELVRQHAVPYATVTTGVTFAVRDQAAVLARWERQIAALRAAA